eukprot:4326290-Prymnesium_polylepis.1
MERALVCCCADRRPGRARAHTDQHPASRATMRLARDCGHTDRTKLRSALSARSSALICSVSSSGSDSAATTFCRALQMASERRCAALSRTLLEGCLPFGLRLRGHSAKPVVLGKPLGLPGVALCHLHLVLALLLRCVHRRPQPGVHPRRRCVGVALFLCVLCVLCVLTLVLAFDSDVVHLLTLFPLRFGLARRGSARMQLERHFAQPLLRRTRKARVVGSRGNASRERLVIAEQRADLALVRLI